MQLLIILGDKVPADETQTVDDTAATAVVENDTAPVHGTETVDVTAPVDYTERSIRRDG